VNCFVHHKAIAIIDIPTDDAQMLSTSIIHKLDLTSC